MSLALSHGVFGPTDLTVLQTVFDRLSAEPWFPANPEDREDFAGYIFRMYMRGLVLPDRLEALCLAAAKERFASPEAFCSLVGRRFLVVEDEYVIAREAIEKLTELGAKVVGPVSTVSDALDIITAPDAHFDAALLDIALDGQLVYPVAALLETKQIPFAFVTGVDLCQVPASYRMAPTFAKPANWAEIASALACHATRSI